MKLFIKNKLVSFGGSSFVTDEGDNQVYRVKGKIFSPTHKKKIYDMDGNLLFVVRNKFWQMFSKNCFIYNSDGEKVAKVQSKDWDFKNAYYIMGYNDEIEIAGRFLQFPNMELTINKNGQKIGTLTKNFTIVRDSYTLDIENEDEAPLFVALTIAVDNILDKRRSEARSTRSR